MKKEITLAKYIIKFIEQGLWDNPDVDTDYDLNILADWIENAISEYEGGCR